MLTSFEYGPVISPTEPAIPEKAKELYPTLPIDSGAPESTGGGGLGVGIAIGIGATALIGLICCYFY